MFTKILIANRGEIACRVIDTARRMGIATVAVYSEADAQARHVQMADEAVAIGPAPARQSYLRGDAILEAARRTGAQAIHPGYGFLSENADFAEACGEAGIVFIGPRPESIRAMGSKSAAKALMEKSGVPLVPGYHGADQSPEVLRDAASRIGYPVLLKASAGGGGRGMRVVESTAGLDDAIARARGEAQAAFGDGHLLVEKYLTRPRHIEVQVFGDTHGTLVSLFERDCSVQRRHQKVLEESPAPGITPAQRVALGEAAVAAARAVNYVGAGTVEFIYEDDRFYFMEMNTRLQVEHPVTEFVTGLDLVEWQFRVAAGQALPLGADALRIHGHAIEARICAEDPEADFAPSTGRITLLRQPAASRHVRIDTGIREGDTITPNYDSMIAKLIVWDEDRPAALRRMAAALDAYALAGPRTNLDLLRRVVRHEDFAAGRFDTGFIARHPAVQHAGDGAAHAPEAWAAAVLAFLATPVRRAAGDPFSPWDQADAWRLNGPAETCVELQCGDGAPVRVAATRSGAAWRLDLPGGTVTAALQGEGEGLRLLVDGVSSRVTLLRSDGAVLIMRQGVMSRFTMLDRLAPAAQAESGEALLTAPTPARVVAVLVEPGAVVEKGQKLLVLEAMKMETAIAAPHGGTIETVHVRADDMVPEGARLISFATGAD